MVKSRDKFGVLFKHVNKRNGGRAGEDQVKGDGVFDTQTLWVNEASPGDVVEPEPFLVHDDLLLREAHVFFSSWESYRSGS